MNLPPTTAPVSRRAPRAARRLRSVGPALLALLLAGCNAFSPVPDNTRFYTLSPAADTGQLAVVAPAEAPVVGVRVTSVASHLRPSAMVVRTGEHELAYDESHRWASRLDDAVGRALAGDLQRLAGSRTSVSVAPPLRTASPDVVVEIDLLACEGRRDTESSALLIADWRIYRGREDKPAASGRLRVEKPGWDGADFGQLAGLLASAVDDLAQAVGGPAVTIAAQRAATGGD